MQIKVFVTGPFEVNSYIVFDPGQKKGFIVDPGLSPNELIRFIEKNGIDIKFIINTHGHVDHIQGNQEIVNLYQVPIFIGKKDAEMLDNPQLNLSAFLDEPVISPPAKRLLEEDNVLTVEGCDDQFRILHTPGHSPGSICLYSENSMLICGDVLFLNSIGRTDFPGSDHNVLIQSIKNKLFSLPKSTEVYPGHGPGTAISREIKYNPFLR